jgi:hypothetical protein
MALETFGVTAAIERADMFPQWGDFDANSSPTSTTVGRFINEEAADLAARLYAENVTASSLTLADNEVAYTWCAKTLKLMVARRIFAVATQGDPELRKSYEAELKARLELLDDKGATALGDSSLDSGDAPADGPTTHINQFGLTTLAAADMSDLDEPLQLKDQL